MKRISIFFIISFFCSGLFARIRIVIPDLQVEHTLRALDHILTQNYQDWQAHIITTSRDRAQLLQECLQKIDDDRLSVIFNEKISSWWHTAYSFIHDQVDDEDIVVLHDGASWCAHKNVLDRIVAAYEHDAWTTYCQYEKPDGHQGNCHVYNGDTIKFNRLRSTGWMFCPLRSFKGWIFKHIRLEDFLVENAFCDYAGDVPLLPILEVACPAHITFMPEVSAVCSRNSQKTQEQQSAELAIRLKHAYQQLKQPVYHDTKNCTADIVIFSKDRPLQLYALLESIQCLVKGYASITVIFHAKHDQFARAYNQVQQDFPGVKFIGQSPSNPRSDFKRLLLSAAFEQNNARYIAFAVDDDVILKEIDLTEGARLLEQTGAYGIFYKLGYNTYFCYTQKRHQGNPPFFTLKNDILVWQFCMGRSDFAYPNSVDFVLYKKEDIQPAFVTLEYTTPNTLEGTWDFRAKPSMTRLGICYKESHMVNIPLNIVNNDNANRHMRNFTVDYLLELFNQGCKIDIVELRSLQPNAAHFEYGPRFIKR